MEAHAARDGAGSSMRREGFLEAAAALKDCIASARRLDTHDNPSQLLVHDTVS